MKEVVAQWLRSRREDFQRGGKSVNPENNPRSQIEIDKLAHVWSPGLAFNKY